MIKRIWFVGSILPWFKTKNNKASELDTGVLFYKKGKKAKFVPYARIKRIVYGD